MDLCIHTGDDAVFNVPMRKDVKMKIRYRVWDGKYMFYPEDDQYSTLDQKGEFWDPSGSDPEIANDIPMLSTGLNDCDGKEIFEGDRFKSEIIVGLNGQVAFARGAFMVKWDDGAPSDFLDGISGCLRIIGNIHENDK